MNESEFFVYELFDDNGDVFYIGKGKRDRISNHRLKAKKGSCLPVHRRIRKLWKNGINYHYRKIHENLLEEEAFELEKETIAKYGISNLTNLTFGGEGHSGLKPSIETLRKMSLSQKGRIKSEQERKNISLSLLGRKLSPSHIEAIKKGKQNISVETCRKISESKTGIKTGPKSEETKKKISESKKSAFAKMTPNEKFEWLENRRLKSFNKPKRRPISEEEKQRSSLRFKGVPRTEEVKQKIRASHIARQQLKQTNSNES
jgi:hypothetical protein